MLEKVAPVRVDPSTASRDFWERYHRLRRARQVETRPDDPVRPDDAEEARVKRENPFEIEHRYEISRDGTMLSSFFGETARPGTAGYESNKHLFWADVYVHPEHRRRGVGSSWLPVILELMGRHANTTLGMGAEDAPGHAFLQSLGAEPKLQGAENRLKLADVDWDMVERWVVESAARSPRTRLEIYDEPIPQSMWDEFAPQLTAMLNTIPFEGLDIGRIVVTRDHMREHNERLAQSGERQHTVLTREPDGLISGMTDVTWAPYRSTIIHQRFTGVRADARGRGIGKWIKAAMLLRIRELYLDARWISTENAGSNAPMLAINHMLGFRQYRASTEYQVDHETLASQAKKLAV